jgi:Sec-independent protein secretion pathway component TatC
MLAVPMCLLYEAGLFVSRFITARPKPAGEAQSTTP